MTEGSRFGEKLRDLRIATNLTLSELATIFGYSSHSYLSEIESGRKAPTIAIALMTSRYFKVSTDILLKDELELDDLPLRTDIKAEEQTYAAVSRSRPHHK